MPQPPLDPLHPDDPRLPVRKAVRTLKGGVFLVAMAVAVLPHCTAGRAVKAPVIARPVAPLPDEALVDRKWDGGVEKLIPASPEDWQKKPPCDADQDERSINGACWQATSRRPPCGALWRHGEGCFRPIQKAKPQPLSGE